MKQLLLFFTLLLIPNISFEAENKVANILSTTGTIPQIYYSSNYIDFETALSTIGSSKATLVINTPQTLADGDTLTIPSTLTLWFADGGSIDGVSGGSAETLIINGAIEAGLYQIFGSSLKVTFGAGGITEKYPQWWGGKPDADGAGNGTDNSTAINAAIASGPGKVYLSQGLWGLGAPIIFSRGLIVLEGESRVGTYLSPLSADISSGPYPNAMIVNTVNTSNSTIQSLRFHSGGVGFAGWCISAVEGGSGSQQAFLSVHMRDLWVAPGTRAKGFFTGGLYDSWADHIQFENCKVRFNLNGAGIGNILFSNIDELHCYDQFILTDGTAAHNITVSNVVADNHYRNWWIELDNVTKVNITNVSLNVETAAGAARGLLRVTDSTGINISNYTTNSDSGTINGFYIDNSQINIGQGSLRGIYSSLEYPVHVTGPDNDISINGLNLDDTSITHYRSIVFEDSGGNFRMQNSNIRNSFSEAIVNLGTETINATFNNNQFINSGRDRNFATTTIIDFDTSGRLIFDNNLIVFDDTTVNSTFAFDLRGTGKAFFSNNRIIGITGATLVNPGSTQKIIRRNNFYLSSGTIWAEWVQTASHDYDAAVADWFIDVDDVLAEYITVTNASGAVSAILPIAIQGHQYTIYNNSGQTLTFKVTGQSGGTIADGKHAVYVSGATDVIETYEQP